MKSPRKGRKIKRPGLARSAALKSIYRQLAALDYRGSVAGGLSGDDGDKAKSSLARL